MRHPYRAEDARDAEIARLLGRMEELDRQPGRPAPPELLSLLAAPGGAWRTGWVPMQDGPRLLVAVGGPPASDQAPNLYGYLRTAHQLGRGRIGPVARRALPRPLAGYTGEGHPIVLADWLAGGEARRVLRALRGARRSRPRVLSLAAVPLIEAFRGHLSISSVLPPVLAPATGTASTAMAAVAPLATAAAIATSPAVLPSMEAWIVPPAHELEVAHTVPIADDTELLTALPGHGRRRPQSGALLTSGQPASPGPAVEKDAVSAPPVAAARSAPPGSTPVTPPVDEPVSASPTAPVKPPPCSTEEGAQPPAQTSPPVTEPTGPAEPEQPTGDTPADPPASEPVVDPATPAPEHEPSAPEASEPPAGDPAPTEAPTEAAPTSPAASTPVAVVEDGDPAAPPADDPDDPDPSPTPELDAE
ncbi:hypothetical protein [Actinomadura nitritigenes]|uniref:hypothetical protein n=1 Tax=Actinomadura nitritigenes TaxID=134602 RepID=UPI003D90322A